MKQWFKTEQEANEYKEKHQLFARVPEYIKGYEKWALVFPLKAHVTVRQPHGPTMSEVVSQVFQETKVRIPVDVTGN